jgi:hypothetical protein
MGQSQGFSAAVSRQCPGKKRNGGPKAPDLARLGHLPVRLRALIELRRIEVSALRCANRPSHIAITGVHDARQGGGKVEQKCVTACHSQWASRDNEGIEVCVGEADWPHACPVTAFRSGIRLNAGARNATRRLFSAHIVLEKTERSSWL